jgi:hypothetical protein
MFQTKFSFDLFYIKLHMSFILEENPKKIYFHVFESKCFILNNKDNLSLISNSMKIYFMVIPLLVKLIEYIIIEL